MPAATTSDTKLLRSHKDVLAGCVRNLVDDSMTNAGVEFCWGESFTIPTTSQDDVNDIRRLVLFPSGAYITDLRVTASDMDANATPTMAFSILTTDSSDVTKQTLISASTIGQAGGTARIADSAVGKFVGDQYLVMKITAVSATPTSGTLKIFFKYCVGLNTYAAAGLYPLLTDAQI